MITQPARRVLHRELIQGGKVILEPYPDAYPPWKGPPRTTFSDPVSRFDAPLDLEDLQDQNDPGFPDPDPFSRGGHAPIGREMLPSRKAFPAFRPAAEMHQRCQFLLDRQHFSCRGIKIPRLSGLKADHAQAPLGGKCWCDQG